MPMIASTEYVPSFAETTVYAKDLKRGDLGKDDSPITQVEVKTKFTYVTFDNGDKPAKLENDFLITVRRETEESKEARYEVAARERRNRRLLDWYESYEELARTKIEAERMNAIVSGGGLVDAFRMEQFIKAQADDRIAAEAYRMINNWMTSECSGSLAECVDLVAVAELFVDSAVRRLTFSRRQGLSRSTSVVSNVMEDAECQARVEFIDNTMWGGDRF